MARPIIGLSLDWQPQGTFSTLPHFALREHYFHAIYKAGGLPIAIPYLSEAIDEYLAEIDGLLVPGGDFAFPESWYIASDEPFPYQPSPRIDFDISIINAVLARDIPLLGICAGMQIMGGISGCKLSRNIHKDVKTSIDHLKGAPREEYCHKAIVTENTLLKSITGLEEFEVNSAHCEAIIEPSDNVVVSAIAEDGVIEAIEIVNKRFAIGVEWHPEFFLEEGNPNFALFEALIKAASSK